MTKIKTRYAKLWFGEVWYDSVSRLAWFGFLFITWKGFEWSKRVWYYLHGMVWRVLVGFGVVQFGLSASEVKEQQMSAAVRWDDGGVSGGVDHYSVPLCEFLLYHFCANVCHRFHCVLLLCHCVPMCATTVPPCDTGPLCHCAILCVGGATSVNWRLLLMQDGGICRYALDSQKK